MKLKKRERRRVIDKPSPIKCTSNDHKTWNFFFCLYDYCTWFLPSVEASLSILLRMYSSSPPNISSRFQMDSRFPSTTSRPVMCASEVCRISRDKMSITNCIFCISSSLLIGFWITPKKKKIINLWKWVNVSYTMSYLIQDTVHAHHYIYMCRKLIYLIHLTSPTDSTILILVVLPCNFSPHRPSNRVTYTAAFISSTHPRLLPAFSCSSKRFAWRTISVR